MRKSLSFVIPMFILVFFSLLSCSGEDGTNGLDGRDGINGNDGIDGADGLNSLITTVIEQPGVNCSNGGYRIDVGLDTNDNGELEAGEVESSEYLCNADPTGFTYQTYVSLLNQTDTDNPVATVVENSLGLSISWARESQGIYLGTLDRSIDIGKTVIFYSTPSSHTGVRGELVGDNQVRLELQNGINVFADNFSNLSFELREYE
ncbi:hypothetical protein AB1A65_13090 [Muricauda sp. ANG21]|uniref:DUF7151 family protein n=1 Tax=Allomuricauda sp. ANG21 TaxID=3042468 RepID=UPI003455B1E7